jgi:hypothetical protein
VSLNTVNTIREAEGGNYNAYTPANSSISQGLASLNSVEAVKQTLEGTVGGKYKISGEVTLTPL